jgi:hypothetical protein
MAEALSLSSRLSEQQALDRRQIEAARGDRRRMGRSLRLGGKPVGRYRELMAVCENVNELGLGARYTHRED